MVSEIQNINIDLILPNRFQPRLVFDEKSLNELAESIKEHGILEPIIVRKLNDKYEIIAGERRYKAANLAGLTQIPAIIKNLNDYKSAQIAIVENVQRKNLNPMEEAKSYKRVLDKGQITQEELAKQLSVSQSSIANKLRLLNLDPTVQQALSENKISERHARSLLKIKSPTQQSELLDKIIEQRLTVKELDDEIKVIDQDKQTKETQDISINIPTELDNKIIQEEPTIIPPELDDISIIPTIEENITMEDQSPEQENISKSIFDFKSLFEMPEETEITPSLEELSTNLDTGSKDEIFNPFKYIEEQPEEKETIQEIKIPDPIPVQEQQEETIIKPNNISTVKEAIKNLQTTLENNNYEVILEDYDFSDLYQVIIKITK